MNIFCFVVNENPERPFTISRTMIYGNIVITSCVTKYVFIIWKEKNIHMNVIIIEITLVFRNRIKLQIT